MYQQLVPLTPSAHGALKLQPVSAYAFAGTTAFVPVVGAELHKCAQTFPVALIPDQPPAEGESPTSFSVVALLSLKPGENWFVSPQDGRWMGSYVPAAFRAYPFALIRQPENPDNFTLCIDPTSANLNTTDGTALFEEDGQLAPLTRQISDFMVATEQNRTLTRQAIAAIAAAGLIVPWDLKVQDGDAVKQIAGIYRIDEDAFNKLPDDQFLALRRIGALPLIYSHFLSLHHTATLGQMSRLQANLKAQVKQMPRLDEMLDFGQSEDMNFTF